MSGSAPRVSIVVSTLDREAHLRRLLPSLRHLDYDPFEVIVVNGPSRDGTAALLAEWEGRVKLRDCPQPNLAASRNIGLSAASGDIVAFIDDDAVPHPRWLRHLADAFGDARIGGVGGFTLDGGGVRFQARKTLCDRFGNARSVSDWFDERPLCTPGAPWYPSLLGTNAAFRRAVLEEVGGYDEAFAYFLDETDLCLRVIDRGWRIVYEPDALVFHHFAQSRVRDARRVPRSRYRIAFSKAYFIARHGEAAGAARIAQELGDYERIILAQNAELAAIDAITPRHRYSLQQDLHSGLADGAALARERKGRAGGDWDKPALPPAFLPFEKPRDALAICLISRAYPPAQEAGIARWTQTAAESLAARGHRVHVVTRTEGEESVVFDGRLWLHSCRVDSGGQAYEIAERYRLPEDIAGWCARVHREVRALKGYGIDLAAFRIWDLEGLACLDDPDIVTVLGLDASFGLLARFKPEWAARPIFHKLVVEPMIAAERACLERAAIQVSPSAALIADLERCYGLALASRAIVAPHGTPAIPPGPAEEASPPRRLRVLYVGRFELLKGIDLALHAAERCLAGAVNAEFAFAGGHREDADPFGIALPSGDDRVRFLGPAGRERLEQLYRQCDVVLVPSRYESFGLVAIEAMAAGRPVIALAAGGLREIVEHDKNGWLVDPGDNAARDLAAAITRLAAEPDALARLSSGAGASFAEKFTTELMAERLEEVFRAAVERQKPASGATRPPQTPGTLPEAAGE